MARPRVTTDGRIARSVREVPAARQALADCERALASGDAANLAAAAKALEAFGCYARRTAVLMEAGA